MQNKYLFCYIMAIGGLLFGIDTAVISGTLKMVTDNFHLTAAQEGNYVGFGLYGCIVGVFMSGILADTLGRKVSAIISACLYLISAFGCYYSLGLNSLCFYRLVGGIGVGITSTLAPLYISEIAPADKRGRLVSLYQLLLTAGILLAYVSNTLILIFFDKRSSDEQWRLMYFALAIPSLVYFFLLFLIPESPRWLKTKHKLQLSAQIAEKYHIEIPETALIKIPLKTFFKGSNLKRLVIGLSIPFLGQFSGINAIIYYGPKILSTLNVDNGSTLNVQVLFGGINLLSTFIAIKYIDRIGRKPLLIYGLGGIIISLTMLSFLSRTDHSILLIFFVLLFVACYAFSLGPIQWVVISELFPASVRGKAVSLCTLSLWIAAALVGSFFPVLLQETNISMCFVVFGLSSTILLLLVIWLLSENKAKSLENIGDDWNTAI